MKKNIIILLLLVLSQATYSQVKLPALVLPSPEAAEITKYGQIPVSQFSGIPQISIPVYTVREKDINVPISLDYHAAGIKVNDYSTWVGAGWSLNSGGVITRVVKGRPDEDPNGVLNIGWPKLATKISQSDYTFCEDAVKQVKDTQSDQFFYNFSGYSGSFVFSANGVVKTFPYDPRLIISFVNRDYFIVTTDAGVGYYFKDKEKTTSKSEGGSAPFYSSTTSWYLSKILSSNKKDSVNFTYTQIGRPDDRVYNNSASIGGYASLRTLDSLSYTIDFKDGVLKSDNTNYLSYENIKYLSKISFANGSVNFIPESGARTDYQGGYILKKIVVQNNSNAIVKNILLEHDYFYSSSGFNPYAYDEDKYRLKLLAVDELDINGALVDKYRMAYNETQLLPPRKNCGTDYWGYFNGHADNQTLLSADNGGHIVNYNNRDYDLVVFGNRESDENAMKACILTRLYYPTGGYTDFDFESNKIYTNQSNFETRVYSVSAKLDDVPNDPYRINTFVADTAVSTSLVLNIPLYNDQNKPAAIFEDLTSGSYNRYTTLPGQQSFQTIPVNIIKGHTYRLTAQLTTTGAANENPDLEVLMSMKWDKLANTTQVLKNVGGLRIKSIKSYLDNGTLTSQEQYKYGKGENGAGDPSFFPYTLNRKSFSMNYVYYFTNGHGQMSYPYTRKDIVANPIYNLSNYESGFCVYTTVTKYVGITSSALQKTVYTYDFESDDQIDDSRNTSNPALISNAWKSGSLIKEEQFKNTGGSFSLLKKTTNTYGLTYRDTTYSLNISRARILSVGNFIPDQTGAANNALPNTLVNSSVGQDYSYYDYPRISGAKLLATTTDTLYESTGPIGAKQTYIYNNLSHLQPTSIQSVNSKSQPLITVFKYPSEMVSTGSDQTGIYANMINKNLITSVVETAKSVNGQQINLERNNYYLTADGLAKKQTLEIQNGQSPSERRIDYKLYNDLGDILTVAYTTGPATGYQWGYNKQYPVAMCENAGGNEFYYESYEENTAAGVTAGASHTGLKYTTNASVNWSRPNTRNYVISYWYLSNGIWKYSGEQTYTNAPFVMTGGTGYDDVRIYPADAQMTTYTYAPLIGMTSMTDTKAMTTTYEYDNLQRLMNIKDKDGNIVKHMDYHYQNQ